MALKAVLASLEGVPEHLAPEYKPGEGGKFYLDLEGLEDEAHPAVGALVRAKKREAEGRGKAEGAAKELREKLEALTGEMEQRLKGVIPKENAERLEQSYKQKLADREAELSAELGTLKNSLRVVLVDNVAQSLAAKLASDPVHIPLLLPHITKRLAVEVSADGAASTRVLDVDGKPSASTLEDLAKEFLGTPMFGAVLSGSKATGGGASGASHASGAPGRPNRDANLAKLNPKNLVGELKARAGE